MKQILNNNTVLCPAQGGMKAVVWTDAIQMMIIVLGTFIIAVVGVKKVGGASEVMDIVTRDNRINFLK